MRLWLGTIAGFLGGFLLLLAVVTVNAGYVYRVECPRAGGGTETEWTYRINSVVPYVGYDRTGCEVHSSTRVGLDAVGLWKLGEESPEAVVDHSSEYDPALIAQVVDACVADGDSRGYCECTMDELTFRFSPDEIGQVVTARTLDELPGSLEERAKAAAAATDRDCPPSTRE